MNTTIPRAPSVRERASRRRLDRQFSHLQCEVTVEGRAAALLERMLPHLDGASNLEAIAAQLGERIERVGTLAERLASAGVLALARPDDESRRVAGEEFYESLHRRYASHWLAPVYEHPLWEKITSGRATRSQVLGFAFEKYHYIEGAYEHMAVAATSATARDDAPPRPALHRGVHAR